MGVSNLYLLNYNNYFNRIIRREQSLEQYMKYQIGNVIMGVNFTPNDGVDTKQIINWKESNGNPNYVIVTEHNDNGLEKIKSRWFVKDQTRTTANQYELILKRDVLADYLNETLSSPCLIERGSLAINNPLIFQREGVNVNQIKKEEKLLFDKTKTPWVIGYIDNKYPTENVTIKGEIKDKVQRMLDTFPLLDNIKDSSGNIITGKPINVYGQVEWPSSSINFNIGSIEKFDRGSGQYYRGYRSLVVQSLGNNNSKAFGSIADVDKDGYQIVETASGENWSNGAYNNALTNYNVVDTNIFTAYTSADYVSRAIDKYKKTNFNWTQFQRIISANISQESNQLIDEAVATAGEYTTADGKIYEIKIKNLGSYYRTVYIGSKTKPIEMELGTASYIESENIYNQFQSELKKIGNVSGLELNDTGTPYAHSMYLLSIVQPTVEIQVVEKKASSHGIQIDMKTSMNSLNDAPYKMIAFPYYGQLKFKNDTINMDIYISDAITQCIANNLGSQQSGGGFVYDFQLLPYCPINDWIVMDENDSMVINEKLIEGIDYSFVKDDTGSEKLGMIFYSIQSKFTLDIKEVINIEKDDPIKFKTDRETTVYRLVSSNFANYQEIDPWMNGGIEFINVDCTYKPITPYIKLNINYRNLYGKDFDDDRGLICGGDYSLPIISNAWTQYQINNKNYANIFERESQHLEVAHEMAQDRRAYNAIIGGVQSTIGVAGNIAAGNYGGAAAGAGRGALGGLNYAVDKAFANKAYDEAMSMRKDMFQFNIQNIQAKPNGLVKTSAFNYNNKAVPFIEKYESTDEEKEIFMNKIKYTGMTVNAIGKLYSYIEPGSNLTYVKGQMIMINKLNDDAHVARAIADEVAMGVFINLEGSDS